MESCTVLGLRGPAALQLLMPGADVQTRNTRAYRKLQTAASRPLNGDGGDILLDGRDPNVTDSVGVYDMLPEREEPSRTNRRDFWPSITTF